MPSEYMRGDWSLHAQDDGAWTLETHKDDGRLDTFIAMRAAWPSRAAESLANGHLCKASPKMYEALQAFLKVKEEISQHADRPISEQSIHHLENLQKQLHSQVVAAVAEAEGAQAS